MLQQHLCKSEELLRLALVVMLGLFLLKVCKRIAKLGDAEESLRGEACR